MGKQKTDEARQLEERAQAMLLALVRAYRDPLRPHIRQQGLDERDLAFEADLLIPAEVELPVYASQKRGAILRVLREMKARGWVDLRPTPPIGAYSVVLQAPGEAQAFRLLQPWWSKVWERLRGRGNRGRPLRPGPTPKEPDGQDTAR